MLKNFMQRIRKVAWVYQGDKRFGALVIVLILAVLALRLV